MRDPAVRTARFIISEAGRREIEVIRATWDATFPDDPADAVWIAWAQRIPRDGEPSYGVFVSFYSRSRRQDTESSIQVVSGLPVLFFARDEDVPRFDGKVVDFAPTQGFFLREP